MNNVQLIGRLTKEPTLAYTAKDQKAVCKFNIAIDRVMENSADFPQIVVFDKQAENCSKFLGKGRLVGITGRLETNMYEREDGTKNFSTYVVARSVEFLDRAKDAEPEFNAVREKLPF